MPEQSPEVIERFVLWVYTGKLLGNNEEANILHRRQLVDLYIVGDMYGVPELQNSVMDCLVARVKTKTLANRSLLLFLHHIYENTPKGCCLQRFLVELAVTKVDFSKGTWFEDYKVSYPQQYLMDLVREFHHRRQKTSENINWNNIGCRYHVHPEDVVKPAEGHSHTSPEQGVERV